MISKKPNDEKSGSILKSCALAAVTVLFCGTALAQTGIKQPATPSETSSPNASVQQNGSQSQINQAPQPSGDPVTAMTDKLFLKNALEGSMAEVQVAQLALTKSSNDQVKQFAQKMIHDHTILLNVTKSVATKNGVDIPSGPSKKEEAMITKLQALSGTDFDKAYVKDMVKDHKSDDNDFKTEASTTENPAVKNLASQAEPIIAGHLQMIVQISKSMGS